MRIEILRVTGSGFVKTGSVTDGHPVEFRHWQEVVDEAEAKLQEAASSEEEEAVVELWLEDPASFQTAFDAENGVPAVKRGMFSRADNFSRSKQAVATARQSNWDQELADAQTHVASVLKNLGNAR